MPLHITTRCALTVLLLLTGRVWADTLPDTPANTPVQAPPTRTETAVPAPAKLPAQVQARYRNYQQRTARPLLAINPYLDEMLPQAALAAVAYCDDIFDHQQEQQQQQRASAPLDDPACENRPALTYLERTSWSRLFVFPADAAARQKLNATDGVRGLRFTVFARDLGDTVHLAVAFRGTDFSSWADWHANLRWFLPGRDQYDVVAELVPGILALAKQQALARRDQRPVVRWQITSTGHSLGGGLAQLFAYKSREVDAAVVFDPSPVTGYHSCVKDEEVHCNVPVWRIYQRGEILAYVRSATRLFYQLSENITELELDLFNGRGAVGKHSMLALFTHLHDAVIAQHGTDVTDPSARRMLASRPDCSCWAVRRPLELQRRQDVAAACQRLAEAQDGDENSAVLATAPTATPIATPAAAALALAAAQP